jgi:hypothetical protein
MIGSDDVLACFIAGNTFTWDDWFRQETLDDSLQPTIDMLLNVTVFIWFGAVCPWYSFVHNSQIPIYRLIFLGIFVLLLRRPPVVFLMHKKIHQIEEWRQALFVGFFGPIGVSAIFYLYVSLEYLQTNVDVDGQERADAERLGEVMTIVVWFLVICSIVVHGLSIPLGKLGFYIPRTISIAISQEASEPVFHVSDSPTSSSNGNVAYPQSTLDQQNLPPRVHRIGRSFVKSRRSMSRSRPGSKTTSKRTTPKGSPTRTPIDRSAGPSSPTVERVMTFPQPSPEENEETELYGNEGSVGPIQVTDNPRPTPDGHLGHLRPLGGLGNRSIRFPDEEGLAA